MGKLLKFNLRNIFHNKLIYICFALSVLLNQAFSFISALLQGTNNLKIFPQIVTMIADEPSLISILFIVIFCCYDFSEDTTKNIIARGYSRTQLLFSKYISSLIGVFAMILASSLLTFILYIKNGFGYDASMVYPLLKNIVAIIAYVILYATIALLLEKNGVAISTVVLLPIFIPLILVAIDSNLKLHISKFWLDNVANTFDKNPTLGNLGLTVLYYLVYIVIFILIGTQLFRKKEIK